MMLLLLNHLLYLLMLIDLLMRWNHRASLLRDVQVFIDLDSLLSRWLWLLLLLRLHVPYLNKLAVAILIVPSVPLESIILGVINDLPIRSPSCCILSCLIVETVLLLALYG